MMIEPRDMEYDVVVVGAGPGGSTAAKHAALGGASVMMIEKRQEIGAPVRCGEGMARMWLDNVGIAPMEKWIANTVRGARVVAPDGTSLTMDEKYAGNECGYVLRRNIFDQDLAKDAAEVGVDIMVKTSAVDVIRDESGELAGIRAKHMGVEFDIKAKIIIAADGFESQVARWCGIDTHLKPEDINTCYQYHMVNIDADKDYNEFYAGSFAPGGYVWVFAKGPTEANIGIGVQASQVKEKGDVKKLLDEFIRTHPKFARGQPIEAVSGAVSVGLPLDETAADHLLIVGDAARQIDPLTGGGIINAIIAGKEAGRVAASAVARGDFSKEFLMEYDEAWREELEDRLLRNYIAKEKLCTISDEVFNKVIDSLQDAEIEHITTYDILEAVQSKHPELMEELGDLL